MPKMSGLAMKEFVLVMRSKSSGKEVAYSAGTNGTAADIFGHVRKNLSQNARSDISLRLYWGNMYEKLKNDKAR